MKNGQNRFSGMGGLMRKIRDGVKMGKLLAIVFLLTGCAGIRWHKESPISVIPPPERGVILPEVSYEFEALTKGFSEAQFKEGIRETLRSEFSEAMKDMGYFSRFNEGNHPGDKKIHLSVQVRRINNPLAGIPAFITGYTLFTFPSFAGETWEVNTDVTTPEGEKLSYSFKDGFTTVNWLPMALVFPFNNPVRAPKEIRLNIYRNLILKMQRDGVIPKSAEI